MGQQRQPGVTGRLFCISVTKNCNARKDKLQRLETVDLETALIYLITVKTAQVVKALNKGKISSFHECLDRTLEYTFMHGRFGHYFC